MGDIEKAPPSLSFDRPRAIRLPWADFAKATNTNHGQALKSAADALRASFEASWNFQDGSTRSDAEVTSLLAEGLLANQSQKEDGAPRFRPLQGEGEAGPGVYARHGSGRWHRLLAQQELSIDAFRTSKLYYAAWEGVFGLELVLDTLPGAVPSEPTETEFIDLRAPFIEARYGELILCRNIAAAMHAAARDSFEKGAREFRIFAEHKQDLLNTARELDRFEQALRKLARQASEMGYTLFVEPVARDNRTKGGDGKETTPIPAPAPPRITYRPVDDEGGIGKEAVTGEAQYGRLYRRAVEERKYTPTMTVYRIVGWLFPWIKPAVVKLPPVTRKVDVHVEVDTLREPHREKIAALRGKQLDIHVCALTENGYETEAGVPLELVMQQCEADEMVRLRSVVFVPSYEFRLTGERVLTGYTLFHRPVAGSTPVAFPELSVRESMEYRTTWLQTEVGELVKAINLAPGERREVTITRSFQQETTETKTASSVFDLASSESTDLATELERTARNETDIVNKMSASASASYNASASGSYSLGPASASASMSASASANASASRDKSVKDIGTEMSKSAQKAARSVNQSRKEEVSTTSGSRTTVSTSDVSVSVVENINQGRTLNLVFHRLYNRYVGKLYLTDLRLTVRSGTEVIAGSGIFPERTYTVDELRRVVLTLGETPLPINSDEQKTWELRLAILREIGTLIMGEYARLTAAGQAGTPGPYNGPGLLSAGLEAEGGTAPDGSTRIFSFGEKLGDVVEELRKMPLLSAEGGLMRAKANAPDDLEAEFDAKVDDLIAELAPMRIHGLPVDATELLVAAEGLFMDAQVGTTPSTEPYSERMREAEVAMRRAEIENLRSQSARNGALASYMAQRSLAGDGANSVVSARVVENTLEIELLAPLGAGDWKLEHDERTVPGVLVNSGSRIVIHDFDVAVPDWAAAENFSLLELVETGGGTRLPFSHPLAPAGTR